MKKTEEYRELASRVLAPNYGQRDLVLVRGKGTRVWDADGREYLDFLSGISVNNLGHCPPAVVKAISAQARTLMHCSNFYLIPAQVELGARLCCLSFADRCFFSNSGAEANEAAIKLARLYSRTVHGAGRHEIVTMRNSFHGRTIATITATGQEKVQKGFEPLVPGFAYADFNDIGSVRAAITERTCAVMLEPVQGEGGVVPATPEFLRALREECDTRGLLLIFDEIQCGMGRCGTLFAYQAYGVEPDLMTLAKALGNGYPVGAMLAREEIARVLGPGTHGSTFGGNPPACAAGLAVLNEMERKDIPGRSRRMGKYLRERLSRVLKSRDTVLEVRGMGLMAGIALAHPGAEAVRECVRRGMLINCTMGNVLRLLPPLTVSRGDCDRAVEIISGVLALESVKHPENGVAPKTTPDQPAPAGTMR